MKLNQLARWPFLLLLLVTVGLIGATEYVRWRRVDEDKRHEDEYREYQKTFGNAPLLEFEDLGLPSTERDPSLTRAVELTAPSVTAPAPPAEPAAQEPRRSPR